MSAIRVKIRRGILAVLVGLAGLLLLTLSAITLFIVTETGSRQLGEFIVEQVDGLENLDLEVGAIQGNLFRGLILENVHYRDATVDASIAMVGASWNPFSLLSASFSLSSLSVNNVQLRLLENNSAEPTPISTVIDEFELPALPIGVAVNRLRLEQVVLQQPQGDLVLNLLSATVALQQQQLDIDDLSVQFGALTVRGQAQAELASGIPLQATIDWEYRAPLLADVFLDANISAGTLSVSGSVNNLTLQHELQQPLAINSDGTLRNALAADAREIDLFHTAADLILPINGMTSTLFPDPRLQTRIEGAVISFALDTRIVQDPLPQLDVALTAVLGEQNLNLNSIQILASSGRLDGQALLDWSQGFRADASFEVADSDPLSYLDSELPIELSEVTIGAELQFQLMDGVQQLDVQVQSLAAQLGNYPLNGNGDISLIDGRLQINELLLATADNQLNLQGSYGDSLAVEWTIVAPQLQQLTDILQGSASGKGTVGGTPDSLILDGELTVQGLTAGALRLDNATLNFSGAGNNYAGLVGVNNITVADDDSQALVELDSVTVAVNGNLQSHQVTTEVRSPLANLDLALAGGFSDVAAQQWQGEISSGQIDSQAGNWIGTNGTALSVDGRAISLAESCWSHLQTRLCIEVSPQADSVLQIDANLQGFPLDEINQAALTNENRIIKLADIPRLPEAIALEGEAGATVRALIAAEGEVEVEFQVSSQNTVLAITPTVDDEYADEAVNNIQRYSWENISVAGNYRDNAVEINSRAALARGNVEGTELQLEGSMEAQLRMDEQQMLAGTATVNFQDLGWIGAFVPDLSQVQGSLRSQLVVSGSLQAPLLAGELGVTAGAFTVNRLGVTFSDLETTVRGDSNGSAQLSGSIKSGDGSLQFTGAVEQLYNENRELTASLQGENFKLASIEDLNLDVSPQISMTGNSQAIHFGGRIHVPLMQLTLEELPPSAAAVSRDVVIISFPEDRPELERSMSAQQASLFAIPLTANVTLTLGEQVSFSGFGMQANLAGNLDIQQLASGSNLTYGEVSIRSGNYKIYGRTLDLSQGRLLFFGAYDNPALDIRAVRVVDELTVGVMMNGTLKNINSQLFSSPVLADNDIISVLVTDKPFSELGSQEQDGDAVLGAIANLGISRSQGLTSQVRDRLGLDTLAVTNDGDFNSSMLTIGKYLSPDLFIRYGIGLFDNQSKVAVDYSLTERIKLQAESGEFQSVDLTYRVER